MTRRYTADAFNPLESIALPSEKQKALFGTSVQGQAEVFGGAGAHRLLTAIADRVHLPLFDCEHLPL